MLTGKGYIKLLQMQTGILNGLHKLNQLLLLDGWVMPSQAGGIKLQMAAGNKNRNGT
jgi:hypothetical protein